jgi:formylglycine-generating enzyme required for sulfatase activity
VDPSAAHLLIVAFAHGALLRERGLFTQQQTESYSAIRHLLGAALGEDDVRALEYDPLNREVIANQTHRLATSSLDALPDLLGIARALLGNGSARQGDPLESVGLAIDKSVVHGSATIRGVEATHTGVRISDSSFQRDLKLEEIRTLQREERGQGPTVNLDSVVAETITIEVDGGTKGTARGAETYLTHLRYQLDELASASLAASGGAILTPGQVSKLLIQLDTTSSGSEDGSPAHQVRLDAFDEAGATRRLAAAEAVARHPRVILLGEPGSGKSTFLRQAARARLEQAMEARSPGPLPIYVQCARLSVRLRAAAVAQQPEHDGPVVLALLRIALLEIGLPPGPELLNALEQACARRGILCLLDGVDEVPTEGLDRLQTFIARLVGSVGDKSRFIVTCRSQAFRSPSILKKFKVFSLAPLALERIGHIARAWYEDVNEMASSEARGRIRDFLETATRDPWLRLSQNPLLLTTMLRVHQEHGALPRQRALLLNDAVQILVDTWRQNATRTSPLLADRLPDGEALVHVFEHIAFHSLSNEETRADISGATLSSVLTKARVSADARAAFFDAVHHTPGLLAANGVVAEDGNGTNTYSFTLRILKEHLAGRALFKMRDCSRQLSRCALQGGTWSIAIQLGVEHLLNQDHANGAFLSDVAYSLCPRAEKQHLTPSEAHCIVWSGIIARLVGLQAIAKDAESLIGGGQFLSLLGKASGVVSRGRELGPLTRVEAAKTLGAILAETGGEQGAEMALSGVPSVRYTMGSNDREAALGVEHPEHVVALGYDFRIGTTPVTVAQFASFTRSGGYDVREWWREAAALGVWSPAGIRGLRDERPRKAPAIVGEYPNLPVAGVSWFEALAFVRWLEIQWRERGSISRGDTIDLPSEAEWELAARGTDGRQYPWGSDFDSGAANAEPTGLGHVTPTGCFPEGASPFGVEDLSGNCWEWTRTQWLVAEGRQKYAYPYSPLDGREDLACTAVGKRVLKGGAFYSFAEHVRCAIRDSGDPANWSDNVTFRVVVRREKS